MDLRRRDRPLRRPLRQIGDEVSERGWSDAIWIVTSPRGLPLGEHAIAGFPGSLHEESSICHSSWLGPTASTPAAASPRDSAGRCSGDHCRAFRHRPAHPTGLKHHSAHPLAARQVARAHRDCRWPIGRRADSRVVLAARRTGRPGATLRQAGRPLGDARREQAACGCVRRTAVLADEHGKATKATETPAPE